MNWLKDALLPIGLALVTGGFSFWWGRQTRVDEIRIKKKHELIQAIANAFQVVHGLNTRLPHWFKSNFGAMDSVQAGVERFKHLQAGLYADDAAAVEELTKQKSKLVELLREAKIYLPGPLCDDLEAYLRSCDFSWSNVWPLFDTYVEGLFDNLLDDQKSDARAKLAKRIMTRLEKASR